MFATRKGKESLGGNEGSITNPKLEIVRLKAGAIEPEREAGEVNGKFRPGSGKPGRYSCSKLSFLELEPGI